MKKIAISTGCFYNLTKRKYMPTGDINATIKLCSKLNIDGVELLLGDAKQLFDAKLNKESIKILKGYKHNTIHAPFSYNNNSIYFMDSKLTYRIFNKLHELYDLIGAKSINMHPQQIKSFKMLKKEYNYTIENMENHYKLKLSDYKNILKKHSNIKFVFDITHPVTVEKLKKIYKGMKKDISYFHLSANYIDHLHLPFNILKEEHLKKFEFIKKLDAHFVLESMMGSSDIKEYKKEIMFVRKWLN